MPRASIADLDSAKAIVLLGADLKEELPVLSLRVRRAVVDLGVPLVEVGARGTGLTRYATTVLRHLPGASADVVTKLVAALSGRKTRTKGIDDFADAIADRVGSVVVVLGRPSVAESVDATVHAASLLASLGPDVLFLSALRRGNVHGALDLGLAPGFLPGRVTLDAARDHFTEAWGTVPDAPGLDAAGILRAAVDGTVKVLVLLGCDPLADFPDRALVQAALAKVDRVVCVGAFSDDAAAYAHVLLPPTVWGEQRGTMSNLEGRVVRLGRKVTPVGTTMEPWRIAAEIAARLGTDFDLETVDEIQDEIARFAPAFAGVDAALVRRARDGVILPLAEHVDALTFGAAPTGAGVSWEPIPPTAEEATAEKATAEPPAPAIPLAVWSGAAPPPAAVPVDAYSLRLVAARTLYGSDRVVAASPSLARLAEDGARLRVHPRDRDTFGVADGDRVRVTTSHGTVELPIEADPGTQQGTAFIASNRRGPGTGDLVDATAPVTDLRVETLTPGAGA
jgi:NADH-quinone oxidoreductase subunit G